jgi:hypothetical protein
MKVGKTVSSGTYSQYPFVNPGTAPNYATAYDHTLKLSDGTQSLNGGARQLMWAKNAFKPGGWSTAVEKPYIDYSGNYWFGDHTSGFSQDYSYLDTEGEQLGSIANTYAPSANDAKWWSINYGDNNDYSADSPPTWNWDSTLRWKFMVLKVTIPTLSAGTGYGGFRLQYQGSSGSFISLPTITKAELTGGPGSCNEPVVWWKEVGGTASHAAAQFPNTLGGVQSVWKATHKTGLFSSGNNNGYNNSNDSGSMDETIAQRATNTDKIHRLWGSFGTVDGNYDLYFRIGLPNQGSKDIQQIRIQFVEVNGSNAITEKSSQTFNFKQ